MPQSGQMPRGFMWAQRRWLFACVIIVLAIVPAFSGLTALLSEAAPPANGASVKIPFTVYPFQTNSTIALENQQPGTTAWEIDPGVSTTFIQGYAGAVSALPGQTVPLYISSIVPVDYHLNVYRIGWYGGTGGRLYFSMPDLHSQAQGVWLQKLGLIDCATCTTDPTTHLVDAHWNVSYLLHIGANWPSGVYLIKLSVGTFAESYIPLVVRNDSSYAAMLVNIPVSTYEAYNLWGGYSLYQHFSHALKNEESDQNRATQVSFNRPYQRSSGAGDFLLWDLHTVRWIERSDIDAVYTTSVDISQNPRQIMHHRLYLDSGHDEYWTKSNRDGVEYARDHGVNLAFLGANDSYWQARLAPDGAGHPNRTLVCYKVFMHPSDPSQDPTNDPMYPAHPELVTAQWRDPILHRPENALLGLMYSSYFSADGRYVPALVIKPSNQLDQLLVTAGLGGGDRITTGVLGYEYDTLWKNGQTPRNLVILAESPVTNVYHSTQEAYSAYYRAPSGAIVFDAGSIWWSHGLDDFVPLGSGDTPFYQSSQPLSNLTANILHAMLFDNAPLFANTYANPVPTALPVPAS